MSYRKIIAIYIRNEHEDGMRVSKEELELTDPKSVTFESNLILWLSVSMRENSYKEIKFVLGSWEIQYIQYKGKYDFRRQLFMSKRYPCIPISDAFRDALCSDQTYAVKLLRVYARFAVKGRDFNAIYDLITGFFDKIGF